MSLTLITGPALEPVTLSEMKLQCGFGPMEDTDQFREQTLAEQLRSAVAASRAHCENVTGRAFITQTWQLTLNRFPHPSSEYQIDQSLDIDLPVPKFLSLLSFTYIDVFLVTQDMMAATGWGYQLVMGGDTRPARLRPPLNFYWPFTRWGIADSVAITFTAGYGPTVDTVPAAIRNAIKIHAKWLFEGAVGNPPPAVDSLLSLYQNLIA